MKPFIALTVLLVFTQIMLFFVDMTTAGASEIAFLFAIAISAIVIPILILKILN